MPNIRRFHPGVYIKDALETMEMTAAEFSIRTGISERTLSAVMNEKGSITFDIAYKLSVFFDNSVNFWTNLQNSYELYIRQEKEKQELLDDWNLIKHNSLKKYLLASNYIDENDDNDTIVRKVRLVTGVNNLSLLIKKDAFVCFKQQNAIKESNVFLQNFWIALALNEARKKHFFPYNRNALKMYIPEIRSLTLLDPEIFIPRLLCIFNECGISFVLLPYLSKSNIYGATKWFSKENVMLAISNRGEKADLFWFTLFHEISHVLMEHRRETLYNINGIDDKEADVMAANMLIPEKEWSTFVDISDFSKASIEHFSKKINILPCIIVGRLHKENRVPYGVLDKTFNVSYKMFF